MAANGRPAIRINGDEHVYIVGTTGSGKTELTRFLLRGAKRVMVLDPKWEFRLDGYEYRNSLPIFWRDFTIVHRPRRGQTGDLNMARMVMEAWKRRNIRIVVDELAAVGDFFPATLVALSEVMRTGRSRRVSVWSASQRPRWTPRLFLSEARAIMMFPLQLAEDRRYIAGMIGPAALEESDDLHQFLFVRKDGSMRAPLRLRLNLARHMLEAVPGAIKEAA
jgi:hypothetical protein